MYYTHITPNIIVGSQPQSAHDVEILFRDHNVGAILNLQQDKDVQYWGIDINSVVRKCKDLGILHMRKPVWQIALDLVWFPFLPADFRLISVGLRGSDLFFNFFLVTSVTRHEISTPTLCVRRSLRPYLLSIGHCPKVA